MKTIWFKILAILFIGILISSCATRKEVVQFKTDMKYLREQLKELRAENEELKQMLRNVNKSIADLKEQADVSKADLMAEINDLKQQSMYLDNKLQDNMSRISSMVDQTKIEVPAQSDSTGNLQNTGDSLSTPSRVDAQKLYNSAYLDLSRGNYELALQGFQQFLVNFPRSQLAANAQYWIGEVYYAQQQYQTALREYQKVVQNYSGSAKSIAALLKIGYTYDKMGNTRKSRQYLQRVIKEYPLSEEAKLAQTRLSEF